MVCQPGFTRSSESFGPVEPLGFEPSLAFIQKGNRLSSGPISLLPYEKNITPLQGHCQIAR